MKERGSLGEFDEIIENIDQLTGEDARAFLKFIHGYLSIVGVGDGTFTESDFVEKVAGLYKKDMAKVIELRKEQIKKSP
ncbi:hypothetical protein [Bacillus tropicus]|uniref:hypothetical protein n=1 Tax=Bacillus tropicus TaxID=2026188 RepID=UPI000BF4FE5D|nr:hypothetical protein [Bacillus tropicus]PEU76605.1 hypothetical protein CN394_24075 [Bacillus anthracis]PFR87835.1 hypothetical protein COK43_21485 [Bacillus cereus]MDE7549253.1 hypothetical protein [Bacillus tropicus]MDE7571793.1 hypothetical protein [Bacillus tropicus]PEZ24656.1 hypothetical protein CN337_07440 [Bacillus anthracis]